MRTAHSATLLTTTALLLAWSVGCGRMAQNLPGDLATESGNRPSQVPGLSESAGETLLAAVGTNPQTPDFERTPTSTPEPSSPDEAPLLLVPNQPRPAVQAAPPSVVQPAMPAAGPALGPQLDRTDMAAADPAPSVGSAGNTAGPPPLFDSWNQPQAVLVLSGELDGYIEPCGCAGKENMKGGLARRDTFLKELRKRGWPVVTMDLGGQIKRFGPQNDMKFEHTIDGLFAMNYDAVGLGRQDLGVLSLLNKLVEEKCKFVSGNIHLTDETLPKFRVVKAGTRKIGITSVLGDKARSAVQNNDVVLEPAADVLGDILTKMKSQADFNVLMVSGSRDEAIALAKKFPGFNLVVRGEGADEPPAEAALVPGTNVPLLEVGHKGMHISVLGLFADPKRPWRYQRVPLDKRYEDSPAMKLLMTKYQNDLTVAGLEGLGVKPYAHPSGRKFVGSAVCADCHTKAHEKWNLTGHGHALETLQKLNPPRDKDPECLSCHVVGWDPQKFNPYIGGFLSMKQTPKLRDQGCENCHGPADKHVAIEFGERQATGPERAAARAELHLSVDTAEQSCMKCHDVDNSPKFQGHFLDYWKRIEHPGKD